MLKILTVAGLATFEIYAAIPAGFAMNLTAWTIFFASLAGGIAGLFVAAFLGEKIRRFFARYRKPAVAKPKTGLVYKIWDRYGIIGLGLFGTFTVGAPVSLAVGLGFNTPLPKLIPWCCLGVFARCAIYTMLGHYGTQLL